MFEVVKELVHNWLLVQTVSGLLRWNGCGFAGNEIVFKTKDWAADARLVECIPVIGDDVDQALA